MGWNRGAGGRILPMMASGARINRCLARPLQSFDSWLQKDSLGLLLAAADLLLQANGMLAIEFKAIVIGQPPHPLKALACGHFTDGVAHAVVGIPSQRAFKNEANDHRSDLVRIMIWEMVA